MSVFHITYITFKMFSLFLRGEAGGALVESVGGS